MGSKRSRFVWMVPVRVLVLVGVGAPAVPTTPELSTTDLLTVEGFVGMDASVLGQAGS